MSIKFSGALKRSAGIVSAISKQLKLVNLKAVKRVTITFDPFDENVKSTREFLFLLSIPRVSQTNPKCSLKTEIVCNRQPAEIKFSLIESAQEKKQFKEIRLLSNNLNTLELLQLCNKHVTPLAPIEEDSTATVLTKSKKQKTKKPKLKSK